MAHSTPEAEPVILRLKPAWKGFFVHFATIAFLVAVALKEAFYPESGRPFPLSPAPSLLLAAALLLYVIFKRRGTEFIVTTRRVKRISPFGVHRELELARIDELKVYRGLLARSLGIGRIVMADSHDPASQVRFFGVEEPKRIEETMARLISEARV